MQTTVAGVLVLVVLGLAALGVLVVRPPRFEEAQPRVPYVVSLVFHGYFLVILVVLGIYQHVPMLAAVAIAMLAVSIGIHQFSQRRSSSEFAEEPASKA